jgi:hypothetical protein
MKCKITGVVKSVKPWVEFKSNSGKTLHKWEAVVDDSDNAKYPNPIPLTCWDREKVQVAVCVGDRVEAEFYLKGRESSDGKRIFLNCNVASLRVTEHAQVQPEDDIREEVADDAQVADDTDDLPF